MAPRELTYSVMGGRCAHTSAVSYLHEAGHGAGQNVERGRHSMDATISLFTSFVPGMCSYFHSVMVAMSGSDSHGRAKRRGNMFRRGAELDVKAIPCSWTPPSQRSHHRHPVVGYSVSNQVRVPLVLTLR